ncbi:MAG: C4-dicarboxylate ABC transporter, partial [Halomonas sp.]|nr:C4-dicarboxylate ABC transporter [Halomonas sp.]HBN61216.1 C4-dicarboxylate ABC transporter [Halomonas sp.]
FFSLVGIMGVSSALLGYFVRDSFFGERLVLLVAGLAMVVPELLTSGLGLLAMVTVGWLQSRRPDKSQEAATLAQ